MRKMLLGILGFATIGLGAAASAPAEAQPYYPGYGHGYSAVQYRGEGGYRRGGEYRGDRGYRPAFAPGPYRGGYGRGYGPGRGYYRPVFAGPRCFVRMERGWNGWRWIDRPVRVCR